MMFHGNVGDVSAPTSGGDVIFTLIISLIPFIFLCRILFRAFSPFFLVLLGGCCAFCGGFVAGSFTLSLLGLPLIGVGIAFLSKDIDSDTFKEYNERERKIENEYGIIDYSEKDKEDK